MHSSCQYVWSMQVQGVNKELIFGPRTGEGKGVLDADKQVHWDQDSAGINGVPVEALMHTAVLGSK